MTYIFLDIDGVLITPSSMRKAFEETKKHPVEITIAEELDTECADIFRKIMEQAPDATLVISSARRGRMDTVLELVKACGVTTERIDKTEFPQVMPRDEEIYSYLKGKTDAEHILILDDDNTIGYRWDSTTGELARKDTATAHLSDYLVLTKARYGLQEEDYDRAMEILEKEYTSPSSTS